MRQGKQHLDRTTVAISQESFYWKHTAFGQGKELPRGPGQPLRCGSCPCDAGHAQCPAGSRSRTALLPASAWAQLTTTTVVGTPLPCAAICATQTASHTVTVGPPRSCHGAEGCVQRLAGGGLHAARLPASASEARAHSYHMGSALRDAVGESHSPAPAAAPMRRVSHSAR